MNIRILSITILAITIIACKGEKKTKKIIETKEAVTTKTDTIVGTLNNVDIASSVLYWKGRKPTEAHDGTAMLKSGEIFLENGKLIKGEFVIDMTTIKNLDIKNPNYNKKLVDHLGSADFFDVAKHPTSKFVITKVIAGAKERLNIVGNLSIKGISKSIVIPASITEVEGVTVLKSHTFSIDRSDFNVKYGSKKFFDNLKDKFIDDMMEFSFEIKTKK